MAFWNKWFSGDTEPVQQAKAVTAISLDSSELHQLLLGSRPPGDTVSVENAMRLAAVYSCVKIIAETVGSMNCYLYSRRGERGEVREQNFDNPLFKLIAESPNHFQTAPEFWQYVMACLLLRGDFFAQINRVGRGDNQRVAELLPIAPEYVDVQLKDGYDLQYYVEQKRVPTEDILHIKALSLDGIRGTSTIQQNAPSINYAINARDFSNTIFTNNGTPRGVLHTDGVLDDAAYENIRSSWDQNHYGEDNWNKVAILEQGLKFTQISMSPADAELIISQKYTRSEIAGMFRVPPHMIGDLERSTNNNIEHQSLEFFRDAILPWLTMIEKRLNMSLLGNRANFFKFDTSELLRGDFKGQVEGYSKLLSMGVMNPNEVREKLGMNPREGGDEYIVATNNLNFGNDSQPPASDENEETPNE